MDEKTKLYIFTLKEVVLIVLFMALIAVVSFLLGARFGLKISYEKSGLGEQERQKVELLSEKEENVKEVVEKEVKLNSKALDEKALKAKKKEILNKNYKKLEGEFKQLDTIESSANNAPEEEIEAPKDDGLVAPTDAKRAFEEAAAQMSESDDVDESGPSVNGKYTVQLGSYRSIEEASSFAEGFKARGYSPIIHQVDLEEKGVWYRVGLGAFDTKAEAEAYIRKEESLFETQDYVIAQFQIP